MARRARIAVLVAAIAVLGMPAVAGAGNPYGSTSTTTSPPASEPMCHLEQDEGAPGDTVSGRVVDAPTGATLRFAIGATPVHEIQVPAGPSFARATPAQTATTEVAFSFEIPPMAPGVYTVTVTGPTFVSTCAHAGGTDFEVLATSTGTGGASGSGGGTIAFTGLDLLVFLLAALLLVSAGVLLRSRARARRRAALARQHA